MDFGIFKCLIFLTTSLFLSQAVVCILWMLHIKMGSTHNRDLQGVQEKLFFSSVHCDPSLAYLAVRDLQSSKRNGSVQSPLLAGNFCTTNSNRVLARERWLNTLYMTPFFIFIFYIKGNAS